MHHSRKLPRANDAGPTAPSAGARPDLGERLARLTAATCLGLAPVAAFAAPPPVAIPTEESVQQPGASTGPFNFFNGITRRDTMLGDWGGLRSTLSQYGISLAVQETSEVLGNLTGGTHKGFDYDGLTQMILQLDTSRAFGWHGGLFNVSGLQIHGRDLSTDNLQSLQTASGIEADRSTRLWELWFQQKFLPEDRLDIKVGQQSLDQEFMVSENASYFINTMFGWPMVPSADLPGGGPAYPLSALGVRVRARPIDPITVMIGVFNGSPVSHNYGDPQMRNPSGTSFPLNGGALVIAELQYSYPSLGTMQYSGQAEPLARVYKIGFWYDSESFADQLLANDGLSLANPASRGVPLNHHGNFSIYAVADQMVWVDPTEAGRTISVFARVMGTPQTDRNFIDFSVNLGLTLHEPFLHRDDDTFGVGMGFAKVSPFVSALDRDTAAYTGAFTPVRSSETYVELTYQYQVTPWWQIQPDAQYVFNPGGGVANPDSPTQKIGNEFVLGVRTNILF
jgi:porin